MLVGMHRHGPRELGGAAAGCEELVLDPVGIIHTLHGQSALDLCHPEEQPATLGIGKGRNRGVGGFGDPIGRFLGLHVIPLVAAQEREQLLSLHALLQHQTHLCLVLALGAFIQVVGKAILQLVEGAGQPAGGQSRAQLLLGEDHLLQTLEYLLQGLQ